MIPEFDRRISDSGIAYHRSGLGIEIGPTLLLIHGVGLRAESWSPLMALLEEHFDVVAIDLPGHGASADLHINASSISLNDYVNSLHDFASELNLSNYIVCGHSLGARIAIEMAAVWPQEIIGLLALNAIYQRSDEALSAVQQRAAKLQTSDKIVGVKQTTTRWFGESPSGFLKQYSDWCASWLSNNNVSGYANAYTVFAADSGPSLNTLTAIKCPSTFMTGNLDPNSSPAMSQNMASLTRGGHSRSIENAAHMMPLTHAGDVANVVMEIAQHRSALTVESSNFDKSYLKEASQ